MQKIRKIPNLTTLLPQIGIYLFVCTLGFSQTIADPVNPMPPPTQSRVVTVEEDLTEDPVSFYQSVSPGITAALPHRATSEAGLIATPPITPPQVEDTVLAEGGSVEIVVFEDRTFNGVYPIYAGGIVFLPQIGSFKIAGMTAGQSEKAIKERLEIDLLRTATVSVIPTQPAGAGGGGVVYVTGEVARPGVLRIPPNETLTMLTAIIRAGGIGPHGDPSQVQLARLENNRREISIMNFDAVIAGVEGGTELTLQDGDIINVIGRGGINLHRAPPPSRGTAYLSGQVKKPGPYEIKDLTVYQTILRNGGLDRFANLKKTYVLRKDHETGQQMKIPVNLHTIIKRGALELDIPVEPGDIIVVPEKFFSF